MAVSKSEKYFVISCDEDGGVSVEAISRPELESRLSHGLGGAEFISQLKDGDPQYWGKHVLIVKGRFVVPRPQEKVTVWEVD